MSQSSMRKTREAKRLRRTTISCERDAMRVFIASRDREAADNRLNVISSNSSDSGSGYSSRSPSMPDIRVPVVVISDEMRRAAEDKLRQMPQFIRVTLPELPQDLPHAADNIPPIVQNPSQVLPPPPPQPPRQAPPRRRHAEVPHRVTYRIALLTENVERVETFQCGSGNEPYLLSRQCEFCLARFFPKETKRRDGRYYLCCNFGKVNIPLLSECPQSLKDFLTLDGHRNVVFRNNVRAVNSLFAMASFKATVPTDRLVGQGHWCFHICGQIYHYAQNIPRLDRDAPGLLSYNQYYFVDAQEAIDRRSTAFGRHIDQETIATLERMFRTENPLVRLYMTAAEVIRHRQNQHRERQAGDLAGSVRPEPTEIAIAFPNPWTGDTGAPTGRHEVAVIFPGDQPPRDVDLVIYDRDRNGSTAELKNLNPLADPMVYPLLFPHGEEGFRMRTHLVDNPRTLAQRGGRREAIIIDDFERRDIAVDDAGDGNFPDADEAGDDMPIRQNNARARKHVTMRQFYRFRIMVRRPPVENFLLQGFLPQDQLYWPPDFSTLHNGGKLFQQYIVDSWVRVEANQLWFIAQNQKTLRKTNLSALRRHLQERARNEGARVGKVVILPRAFLTGRRHINRCYLDAMTTVARHGCPSFFITFTCNPNWPDIVRNLEFKQKFEHRPDLVCRVFHTKLLELIDDLYIKQFFGVPLNYMYVIEFQKRGLPHAHILLTLRPEDRLVNEDDIDAAIQAAFPDRRQHPRLFELIARHMVHGPCGMYNPNSPCMKDGICKKYYPKPYREETDVAGDDQRLNQPEYKRPQNERGVQVRDIFLDNRWVVPHNRYLLAKYDCHLNVECCGSLKSIKYLHKYVHKGPDFCQVQHVQAQTEGVAVGEQRVLNWDEVQEYREHRYVSSMEAAWRLLEYPLADRSHSVVALPVHLPGEMDVIFDEEAENAEILANLDGRRSKLESWFALNNENADAREFRYQDIPEHFTWDNKRCVWQARRQSSRTLGCLIEVSPIEGELFYLRMLLGHVRGALSYENLRTVNGVLYGTYLEACRAMQLLINDNEFEHCLTEALRTGSPYRARALFALLACSMRNNGMDPQTIGDLWLRHKEELILDFLEKREAPRAAELKSLLHIKTIVRRSTLGGDNVSMADLGLPDIDLQDPVFGGVPVNVADVLRDPLDRRSENDEDFSLHRQSGDADSASDSLNEGQRAVFNDVLHAVQRYIDGGPLAAGNLFFVDGPGGCGKTYLYNRLIDYVRNRLGKTYIAVAWTGIAATLLHGGKTVHSAFRLPLNLEEDTVAGFQLDSDKSEEIRNTVAIFWDEAPMTPRKAIQAVDRYLQALMNAPGRPFGGKIVLFGGDFRQLLPVILRASRTQLIAASLKSWSSWRQVAVRRLTENLRVRHSTMAHGRDNRYYANFLLQVGNGSAKVVTLRNRPTLKNLIQLPDACIVAGGEDLIDFVYGPAPITVDSLSRSAANLAILCPTNSAVDQVNATVLARLAGESRTYYSVDRYEGDANAELDGMHVPLDLLHSVNISSLGPHELTLKVGAVVVLIRNVDLQQGLCNGTRLQIIKLGEHMLELKILSGGIDDHRGRVVYIPKMHLVASPSSGTHLPGPMRRFQFPLRLAFAMTVNKSQGQTFQKVGVHLNTPCFTHGQLYVALSRVGSLDGLKVFVRNCALQGSFTYGDGRKLTPNIVFREIVDDVDLTIETDIQPPICQDEGNRRRPPTNRGAADSDELSDIQAAGNSTASMEISALIDNFSQFYVDDWTPDFLRQIDKDIAAATTEQTDRGFDYGSQVWIRPDSEFPLLSPSTAAVTTDTAVAKEKQPLQKSHAKQVPENVEGTSRGQAHRPRSTTILREDPRLPHIQALPRLAVGDEAGTSGLGGGGPLNFWVLAPPQQYDSDSD